MRVEKEMHFRSISASIVLFFALQLDEDEVHFL